MTEMTAFERRVADGMLHRAGPVRPVDDLAVFDAVIAASRSRGWGSTMLSAVKFVAAAVIVALFGGFLLAGLLTTQQGDEMAPAAATESPSQAPTEASLSGMVTEEVEPGVLRVVNDGVRDLASVEAVDVVAGYDGSIWLLREEEFLRLGSDGSHDWPTGAGPEDDVFEVAPDGTLWLIPLSLVGDLETGRTYPDARRGEGRRSSDGEVWTVQPCPGEECWGATLARDGTLWAVWPEAVWPEDDEDLRRVGYLGPTGWQALDGYTQSAWVTDDGFASPRYSVVYDRLFVTDAGDVYGAECSGGCFLHRYEDGGWAGEGHNGIIGYFVYGFVLDVGPDGTVWSVDTLRLDEENPGDVLSRFADGEWAEWSATDLPWSSADLPLPDIRDGLGLDYQFEVAPDGDLWSSLWRHVDGTDDALAGWWEERAAVEDGRLACDGLGHFDGEKLDHYLPGRCITMDIAADGSVWVLADEEVGTGLYVVTPEAVE